MLKGSPQNVLYGTADGGGGRGLDDKGFLFVRSLLVEEDKFVMERMNELFFD